MWCGSCPASSRRKFWQVNYEAHFFMKCASAIFVRCTSDISAMRYAASRAIYGLRRVNKHEYNIAKAERFYIAFTAR